MLHPGGTTQGDVLWIGTKVFPAASIALAPRHAPPIPRRAWDFSRQPGHHRHTPLPSPSNVVFGKPGRSEKSSRLFFVLACTADMLGAMIGLKPVCPPEWAGLSDWNSTPSSDASLYPSKAGLFKALKDAHAQIAAALPAVPESRWRKTTPPAAVRGFLPALGDCFVFVMAAHENMHLGQLSAWRRVQGMTRV